MRFFNLSNLQVTQIALGNKNEGVEMILPVVSKAKKQGLAHIIDESMLLYNEGIHFSVKMKKVDDLEELRNIFVEGLKVVAENYEAEIFRGAKEFILKNKPLIYCNLWDNHNRKEVFTLMNDWGYKIMINSFDKLVPFNPEIHNHRYFFFKYE